MLFFLVLCWSWARKDHFYRVYFFHFLHFRIVIHHRRHIQFEAVQPNFLLILILANLQAYRREWSPVHLLLNLIFRLYLEWHQIHFNSWTTNCLSSLDKRIITEMLVFFKTVPFENIIIALVNLIVALSTPLSSNDQFITYLVLLIRHRLEIENNNGNSIEFSNIYMKKYWL